MFGRFRKPPKDAPAEAAAQLADAAAGGGADGARTAAQAAQAAADTLVGAEAEPSPARRGLFGRLRSALGGTSDRLFGGVREMLGAGRELDDAALDELETSLLTADVGVQASTRLLDQLKARAASAGADAQPLSILQGVVSDMLAPVEQPLAPTLPRGDAGPFVILVVGVNGAGKTTTIGKLASHFKAQGAKVMLAAGDTFRAAAIEQLQVWGERSEVQVVAQAQGADSASVIFDAVTSARARNVDVVIADTAGRLHTQGGLMDELRKVRRVISKVDAAAPHETLLVLDAGIGQNALAQARQFQEAVAVSGLIVTKLDGTAKGGVLLALAEELALPVRFIGVGEGVEDLRPFVAADFAEALLS